MSAVVNTSCVMHASREDFLAIVARAKAFDNFPQDHSAHSFLSEEEVLAVGDTSHPFWNAELASWIEREKEALLAQIWSTAGIAVGFGMG